MVGAITGVDAIAGWLVGAGATAGGRRLTRVAQAGAAVDVAVGGGVGVLVGGGVGVGMSAIAVAVATASATSCARGRRVACPL